MRLYGGDIMAIGAGHAAWNRRLMAGELFLMAPSRPRRRGYDPMALHLSQSVGLCHIEGWRHQGFLVADAPADHGIAPLLEQRIAAWVACYRQFEEGHASWTPQHCRGFDIQRHNREGLAIARTIVAALSSGRQLCFQPVKRRGAYHHSQLVEQYSHQADTRLSPEQGGPPCPAYHDDSRDPARWVRVMGDYSSSGIWHWQGYEMDPDDLPVPAGVKARLADWASRYLSGADSWSEGDADNFAALQDEDRQLRAYSDEGLSIARAIKVSLPDWTVVYFDEALSVRHAIRARFQFEIV